MDLKSVPEFIDMEKRVSDLEDEMEETTGKCENQICPAADALACELYQKIDARVPTRILLTVLIPVLILMSGWVGYLGIRQIDLLDMVHTSQQSLSKQIIELQGAVNLVTKTAENNIDVNSRRLNRLESWVDKRDKGRGE